MHGGISPSDHFSDEKCLQSGLAVFAFHFVQTKTSLRLSRPHARKAVCVLPYKIKIRYSPDFIFMRGGGLEPPSRKACAPQTHAYTNSATRAKNDFTTRETFLKYFSKKHPRIAKFILPVFISNQLLSSSEKQF